MTVPEWIVNDNGELGVMVDGRAWFLYKGVSLEYTEGKHDDGTPMLYRAVGKREFGEVCHPIDWHVSGWGNMPTYDRQLVPGAGQTELHPDSLWRPLPAHEADES